MKQISYKFEADIFRDSKILIIEDDRTQRMMLRQILEEVGFKNVEEAVNGQEGWEKTQQINPDLVILDINMPVLDGFEYCKIARQHNNFKMMNILVQTAMDRPEDKAKIFEVGANDYVIKPVDINEVSVRTLIHLKNSHNLKRINDFNSRIIMELKAATNLIELSLPGLHRLDRIKRRYNIEVGQKFESTSETGGDFWGVHLIDDNKLAMYTIDISGHGLDAALSALRIHTLLDSNVEQFKSPAATLKWLNTKLVKILPVEKYATLFYGIIDISQDTLTYSTASTTSPLIFNKETDEVRVLSGKGFQIGAIDEAEFDDKVTSFKTDDILVLYSDAMTESKNKSGEMFGEERLVDLIRAKINKNADRGVSESVNDIYNEFKDECGENINDDLTLNIYHRLSS